MYFDYLQNLIRYCLQLLHSERHQKLLTLRFYCFFASGRVRFGNYSESTFLCLTAIQTQKENINNHFLIQQQK